MILPENVKGRKGYPVVTGVLDYFPDAIVALSEVSRVCNDQHNTGQPMYWNRDKSTDHADCLGRHLLQRGTWDIVYDNKGNEIGRIRHTTKLAWRALALLQTEIENEKEASKRSNEAADLERYGK